MVSITLGRIPADRWHHCYSDRMHVALKASEDTRKKKPARSKSSDAVFIASYGTCRLGWESKAVLCKGLLVWAIEFLLLSKGKIFLLAKQKQTKAQQLALKWRCRD